MEAIFLGLCFGSCLKGEGNNIELYEALGFDNNRVSQEDIKQAFRKKTLQLHPDKLAQKGIQASPEDSVKFVKCKEAYEILSDKKRRKRYDQVGLLGLKILENPREINPSELIQNFKRNQGDRYKVALFLGLVFGIILIFPIIFALKCDNSSKYGPWTAIWTPMWLVDLLLFMAACYLCASKDDVDDDGTVVVEKITNTVKIFNFLETVLFILIQIFILIKLDDVVNWSWASTFAPWYVYEFVGVLSLIGPAVQSSTAPAPDTPAPHHEEGTDVEQDPRLRSQMIYFEILITKVSANVQICASLFRLWLAIFLAIKLDGKDWNWGLVFLPIWTYFAFQYLVSRYYRIVANNLLQGLNKEDLTHRIQTEADVDPLHVLKFQQHEQMKATSSTVICAQIVPVFMSIMLVCRLESASYSTFLIILPVFLILGCCCLCSMCCVAFMPLFLSNESEGAAPNPEEQYTFPPDAHADSFKDRNPNSQMDPQTTPVYGSFGELHANNKDGPDFLNESPVEEKTDKTESRPPEFPASITKAPSQSDDLD